MAAIPTRRCPACGVLLARDQTICIRCLVPLPALISAPVDAATGETCHLYHADTADAMLLLSRHVLEYSTPGMRLSTAWHNVASIQQAVDGDQLWLYQTPARITMAPGSRAWFSERTRIVPLWPFDYPANQTLCADLVYYGPHLRRCVPGAVTYGHARDEVPVQPGHHPTRHSVTDRAPARRDRLAKERIQEVRPVGHAGNHRLLSAERTMRYTYATAVATPC